MEWLPRRSRLVTRMRYCMRMPGISAGRLASKRWREYRDIRLEALRTEPYELGSLYN